MDQDLNEEFRRRTRILALEIIRITAPIPFSDAVAVIRKQLIKAATSAAANYRAACRARSVRERFAKLCIVVEESDETDFWLDMMIAAGYVSFEKMSPCVTENLEILKSMSSYKKKLESKNSNP